MKSHPTRHGRATRVLRDLIALACTIALPACGADNVSGVKTVSGVPATGTGTFATSPIALALLANITALGNLNPPEHTTPSDHTYWNLVTGAGPSAQVPVYAPAGGVVSFIRGGSDDKIMVNVTNTFVYYLDHVFRASNIAVGSRVQAGDRIGTSSGLAAGIDFGLINLERAPSVFAAPDRYVAETKNADNPLRFYAEPLRSILYAKVNRDGVEKDGQVDYDVPSTLQGNWYLEDVPTDTRSSGPDGWGKQIAFVYDVIAPTSPRISIGGAIGAPAVYGVLGGPAFVNVTTASGLVAYPTAFQFGSSPPSAQTGTVLVQMLAPARIRVEWLAGTSAPAAFSANARIYVR